MKTAVPLVITAMPQEAQPFLELATSVKSHSGSLGEFHECSFNGTDFILSTCGIGLVNAAVTATSLIHALHPGALISAGTCGGIGKQVEVGDVIAATGYRFYQADVTPLGLAPGQLPGLPALLPETAGAEAVLAQITPDFPLHCGEIISGDEFVSGERAEQLKQTFPLALAVDMESAALALTAHKLQVPFVSVRAVSDLCTSTADADFKASLGNIPARSTQIVLDLLTRSTDRSA